MPFGAETPDFCTGGPGALKHLISSYQTTWWHILDYSQYSRPPRSQTH